MQRSFVSPIRSCETTLVANESFEYSCILYITRVKSKGISIVLHRCTNEINSTENGGTKQGGEEEGKKERGIFAVSPRTQEESNPLVL
jgi:hypothetical protein